MTTDLNRLDEKIRGHLEWLDTTFFSCWTHKIGCPKVVLSRQKKQTVAKIMFMNEYLDEI